MRLNRERGPRDFDTSPTFSSFMILILSSVTSKASSSAEAINTIKNFLCLSFKIPPLNLKYCVRVDIVNPYLACKIFVKTFMSLVTRSRAWMFIVLCAAAICNINLEADSVVVLLISSLQTGIEYELKASALKE